MRNLLDGLVSTPTNHQQENHLLILRSESFDIPAIANTFTTSIKNSFGMMMQYFAHIHVFDGNNKTAEAVSRLLSSTEGKIARMNYVVLGDTALPCPDGFSDNFSGYITSMNEERKVLITNALEAIEEFNTFLASFLSNKDSKISLKDDHQKYAKLKNTREAQIKKFDSFFTTGVNQRQFLRKMFNSKTEIISASKEAIEMWKNVRMINPKDIEQRCQMISQRLQQVLDNKTNTTKSEVSKQALVNLAEGSYEVARQVEHLGLFMARTEIASVTTGNILERLGKIIH